MKKGKLQNSGRGQYLHTFNKVIVRNSKNEPFQPAVFISFIAGGTSEEIENGIYNCRLPSGEERRFNECLLHYNEI